MQTIDDVHVWTTKVRTYAIYAEAPTLPGALRALADELAKLPRETCVVALTFEMPEGVPSVGAIIEDPEGEA